MGSMKDKKILVIGASSGMGREVARKVAAEGGFPVLVARRREPLQELAKELDGKALVLQYDMNDYSNISDVYDKCKECCGKLDGMFYSVGVCELSPVRGIDIERAIEIITLNSVVFLEASRCFAKAKYSNNDGSIVGISSYESFLCDKGQSIYAGSKACMETFAKVMAKEFASRRIKVNTIAPAIVDTDMLHRNQAVGYYPYEEIDKIQALGVIDPREVADLAVFLMSDSNGHITGENIHISAGWIGEERG